ncbi:hypothetical protein GCM10010975_28160 [Comamonas phosphati]|nr:hypothetical protein GCM10010975_28160 [Comamonas phosphati]
MIKATSAWIAKLLAAAGLMAAGAAQAHGGVSLSVGIGVPGVVAPVYAAPYAAPYMVPAPVYVAPRPVYYAPPAPVYYAPPVYRPAPVMVVPGPGYGYYRHGPRHWHGGRYYR